MIRSYERLRSAPSSPSRSFQKGGSLKDKCTSFLDLTQGSNKSLYLDQARYDGYFRDRCVFRPDIDIEDTMNVLVQYDTGATMSYSLNAFNAWEGYVIAFNGTRGRLEHSIVESGAVFSPSDVVGAAVAGGVSTRIIPMRGAARSIAPWTGEGGHGGGDVIMLNQIFLPNPEADKFVRASDERGGGIIPAWKGRRWPLLGLSIKIWQHRNG